MNFESVKAVATSKFARQILIAQKHSPKALFAAGAVGVVGATVLACRATLKVSDVLDDHEKVIDRFQEADGADVRTHEETAKEINKMRLKTGLEIAKLYAPSAGLILVSIGALTGSHVILEKRNGAIVAAYAAVDQAYKRYRENVVDKYGKEDDRLFAAGARSVVVEEKLSDGTSKSVVKSGVKKDNKHGGSPYTVLFDETSRKFTREPGNNAMVVGVQQSYANDKLRANGHLFLNEVFDMLGLPRTQAGAVVGWVWTREGEPKNGDNYVDFGIFERDLERGEAFVNGDEDAIWLDFNVDGVIYNKI